MNIDILSIFPEQLSLMFGYSILKRAQDKKKIEINFHNLRDYTNNHYKSVDDYPYGGGAGMVMMIEPIAKCIEYLKSLRTYDEIIYMSPDGELLEQKTANRFSGYKNIIILCGHYKGVDERVRQLFVTKEISIGNYVLSGGELAAAVFCDTIVRLIPGVLGDETSALSDSFQDNMLSPPVYSRPANFNGAKVPDVLLSGNDKEIQKWRQQEAIKRTIERRPELLNEE